MNRRLGLLAVVMAVSTCVDAAPVKMSQSGICHDPDSAWYEKTTRFVPYPSVEACLQAGGRLPRGHQGEGGQLALSPQQGQYKRAYFGKGWEDQDHDCQNTRAEVLIELSTQPVTYRQQRGCTVDRGRWISPFTGQIYFNASQLDIDHLVPLSLAWQRGASGWSQSRRVTFANDSRNLWPVEASLNRSKGDKPISQWLPPANQCEYVYRYIRIMKTYKLEVTPDDERVYQDCRSRRSG